MKRIWYMILDLLFNHGKQLRYKRWIVLFNGEISGYFKNVRRMNWYVIANDISYYQYYWEYQTKKLEEN